jgi:hypothetical protein
MGQAECWLNKENDTKAKEEEECLIHASIQSGQSSLSQEAGDSSLITIRAEGTKRFPQSNRS